MRDRLESLRRWWPAVVSIAALSALIAGPTAWHQLILLLGEAHQLKSALLSLGPIAPIAYILLYTIQIVAAPVPGSPIALASGYLFGPVEGAIYSLMGAALGLTIALSLARRFGRPLVERLVGPDDLAHWEDALGTHSAWLWFVIFLLPIGDAAYYLAGLSRARLRNLILGGVIARIPGQFLLSWVGAQRGRRFIFLLIVLVLVSAAIVLAWQRWGPVIHARIIAAEGKRGHLEELGEAHPDSGEVNKTPRDSERVSD